MSCHVRSCPSFVYFINLLTVGWLIALSLVKFSPGLLNKKDAEGRSPLYRAIKHQNNATEEKLKELGATLDESERERGAA